METPPPGSWQAHIHTDSDPTYEAWKRLVSYDGDDELKNSDPTYEAWKQYLYAS